MYFINPTLESDTVAAFKKKVNKYSIQYLSNKYKKYSKNILYQAFENYCPGSTFGPLSVFKLSCQPWINYISSK